MNRARTVIGAGLLVVEAAAATLGVVVHYGLSAEYGDVTQSALRGWVWAFTGGIGGLALGIVGALAVVTVATSPRRWTRVAAVAVPVLMAGGMLAVTPAALERKLADQYTAVPQCLAGEDTGPGPGTRASRRSQQAFDSIDHVGHFGGGGGSGVGGCDRSFVLTEEVDVLGHYRRALPAAGWQVVTDGEHHLRAERAGLAFEVTVCDRGGIVWAGEAGLHHEAHCAGSDESVTVTG